MNTFSQTQLSFLLLALAGAAVLLSGCSSAPEQSSRYSMARDRAPAGDFDVSDLADARPRYEEPRRAGNKSPYTVWGRQYRVMASNEGYVARGTASWYGEKFHGHKTSNGEIFDMYAMSAAHKSLPIPSYARVTNLDNGRMVIVRVNDRGPFHGDRLIDLSYAAAKKLGYQSRGTARVEVAAITVTRDGAMTLAGKPFSRAGKPQSVATPGLTRPAPGGRQALFLQLGSFASRSPAEALLGRVQQATGEPVRVRAVRTASGHFHRVQVGPFSDEQAALRAQSQLESRGFAESILLTDNR